MKTLQNIGLVLLLWICINACHQERGYTIRGEIKGLTDNTKIYLRNSSTQAIIDSALIKGNKFKLKGKLLNPPEEMILRAMVDSQSVYAPLLMGNENVTIVGKAKNFYWNAEVEGSETHNSYIEFRDLTKIDYLKRDSLVSIVLALSSEEREVIEKEIWDEIRLIDEKMKAAKIEYIKSHPDTYPSIINLGHFSDRMPKDTVQAIYDRYAPEIKNSKYAKVVEVFLKEKIAKVGDFYHDFEGINQHGDKVKLSDIRENYTLVFFKSAGCSACIAAADEVIEINKQYADSLKIVNFSTDASKHIWLKALKRDKVAWNSLWDGKGRFSETRIKYGIKGYPAFVLIDPKGTVIDIWGGYGEGSLKTRIEKNLPYL